MIALAVAGVGVAAALSISLPLPILLGPIFACLIAALLRVPMASFKKVTAAMRTILGVAVGASITPELLTRIGDIAGSIALIPVFVLTIGLIGVPYFRRICGFDGPTSFYSAMPGGLQDMLLFGQEAGGNVRSLSLIHATRVLVLVSALPFILQEVWHLDMSRPPGASAAATPTAQMAMMLFCAVFGWWAAAKIRMFGASILGPLIVAATMSLSGILTIRPPAEAIILSQFFLGLAIGVQYVGITARELRHDILAALGFCVIIGAIGAGFAAVVYELGLAPQIAAILAFSPGGQAEMAVLAIVSGADVAFVVAHHVTRITVVILCAPLFARLSR
jgi:membrane AbrB-like protein